MGKPAILVVEDEFVIRMLLADCLRDFGYHVLEAATGDEGLAILLSGKSVTLIVTDVRMPGEIDGVELSRRAKQLDPARPVIICSGHLLPEEAGSADTFLAKPYSTSELVGSIKKLLGDPWLKDSETRTA
ncbi:response regulator [Sphingopyxis fribergensis]